MPAFIPPVSPLPSLSSKRTLSRRARKLRMVMSAPLTKSSQSNLEKRSVIALRGLSDLGGMTVLHEMSARILLPTTAAASGAADTQLLLGGLIGVWTAALFAQRMRFETRSFIRESEQLPHRWDSAIIHTPSLDDTEVADAVAWLYAFDELDGIAAVDLLRTVAATGSPTMRLRLAEALTAYPVRSNICTSVLSSLRQDSHPLVREAAQAALQSFRTPPVFVPIAASTEPFQQTVLEADEQHVRTVLDRLFDQSTYPSFDDDQELVQITTDEQSHHAWLHELLADRVDCMRDAALSTPNLRQLRAAVVGTGNGNDDAVDVSKLNSANVKVPLFEGLKWSEIHGLATLALLPAGYELLSVLDGVDLPLRFVGLGWLLTVGGMVAYPQSGDIWRGLKKLIDDRVLS